jgi:cation:H+ antiporter
LSPNLLRDVALLVIATGLLWKGADWVVTAASRIARRFGLSDVVIGMTVVALGTSAPEIVVTLVATMKGHPNIAVANVVGSNIFNVGFILGACALVCAIPTNETLVRRDAAALFGASALLALCLADQHLGRIEGLFMMLLLAGFLIYILARSRGEEERLTDQELQTEPATWRDAPLMLAGLAAVVGGAHLLVIAATDLAGDFGLSEWAIGVTIVAGGTSLPELAVSIAAARQGRPGIIAGNLIGSDIHNVLGVLGLAAFMHPLTIDPISRDSILMMVVMVGLLVAFMRSGWRLSRWEGALLVLFATVRWSHDLAPSLWSAFR